MSGKLRNRILLCCLGTLVVFCGCSSKATVTGKVYFKGAPLNGGQVTIVGTDKVGRTGMIGVDGEYKVDGLPAGDARIGVMTTPGKAPPVPGMAKGMDASKMGGGVKEKETGTKLIPIPDKYNSADTSGLTLTIKTGVNQHDIKID